MNGSQNAVHKRSENRDQGFKAGIEIGRNSLNDAMDYFLGFTDGLKNTFKDLEQEQTKMIAEHQERAADYRIAMEILDKVPI